MSERSVVGMGAQRYGSDRTWYVMHGITHETIRSDLYKGYSVQTPSTGVRRSVIQKPPLYLARAPAPPSKINNCVNKSLKGDSAYGEHPCEAGDARVF